MPEAACGRRTQLLQQDARCFQSAWLYPLNLSGGGHLATSNREGGAGPTLKIQWDLSQRACGGTHVPNCSNSPLNFSSITPSDSSAYKRMRSIPARAGEPQERCGLIGPVTSGGFRSIPARRGGTKHRVRLFCFSRWYCFCAENQMKLGLSPVEPRKPFNPGSSGKSGEASTWKLRQT